MGSTRTQYRPRVAVVIPVCNEQDSLQVLRIRLGELQRGLQDRFIVFYLFVDDGSTDRTVELIPRVVPPGAAHQVVSHGTNRGLGEAFRTAFQIVGCAEIVCTIDADCSYRADNLIPMINRLTQGKADVVVASPYHPQGGVDGVPAWRLALSRRCSQLYRLASPVKLYTYTSMFRVYRGAVVRAATFQSSGFVSTVELLMSASYLGYRIDEYPVILHRRVAGTSKMRILRTVGQHLQLLINCMTSRKQGYPSFCFSEGNAGLQEKTDATRFMKVAGSSR